MCVKCVKQQQEVTVQVSNICARVCICDRMPDEDILKTERQQQKQLLGIFSQQCGIDFFFFFFILIT